MPCVCAWRAQCAMLSRCSGRAQGLCKCSVRDCVYSVRRLRPARSVQAVQAATLLRAHVGEHGSVCACTFSSGEQSDITGAQADGEPYKLYFYMSPYMRSKQVHPSLPHPPSLPFLFPSEPRLRASRDIGCSLAHGRSLSCVYVMEGWAPAFRTHVLRRLFLGGPVLTLILFRLCCAHRSSHLMGILPLASFRPHPSFLPVLTGNILSSHRGICHKLGSARNDSAQGDPCEDNISQSAWPADRRGAVRRVPGRGHRGLPGGGATTRAGCACVYALLACALLKYATPTYATCHDS